MEGTNDSNNNLRTADGRVLEQRRSGDTNRRANQRGGPNPRAADENPASSAAALTDAGASSSGAKATGMTPLLLSRLRGIIDRIQSAEITGEPDFSVRKERLSQALRETQVIVRTAKVLPPAQLSLVTEMADTVKIVLATLDNMSEAEAAKAFTAWEARQQQRQEAAAAASSAADAAGSKDQRPSAAVDEVATATGNAKTVAITRRLATWLAVFAADEFRAAPIANRKLTISLASRDTQLAVSSLDELESTESIDALMEAIDSLTDAIVAAKTETVNIEKLNLPSNAPQLGDAPTEKNATSEDEESTKSFSLSALNSVLTDFHEALNADQLMELDAELRRTAIENIVERLLEIQRDLLPLVEGSDEVQRQARGAVDGLLARARRILEVTAAA